MREQKIQNLIRMAISKLSTMFRINVGRAWTGNKIIQLPRNHRTWPGAIVILDPHPFDSGVPKGYSDLTGWTSIDITQEMVGNKIAVFTAIEVKSKTGRTSDNQENFLDRVSISGGIAGVAKSTDDAINIITDGIKYEKN